MIPVVPFRRMAKEFASENSPEDMERQTLLNQLLDAVKQCQIRFGGRTELATESDNRVVCLCYQLEAVLQHGLRKNHRGITSALRPVTEIMKGLNLLTLEPEPVFWHFVRHHLNKHEYERYMLLKHIGTDTGRGRAWLRSALNEHSLERYMHMFLSDPALLSQLYEDWAFMMDQERNSMLPMMSAGLGSILFAINIDNTDLNGPSRQSSPVQNRRNVLAQQQEEPPAVMARLSGAVTERKKRKKKKRPTSQVVSFDDDDTTTTNEWKLDVEPNFNSAPPTCLSSPVNGDFSALRDHSERSSPARPIPTVNVLKAEYSASDSEPSELRSKNGRNSESKEDHISCSWSPSGGSDWLSGPANSSTDSARETAAIHNGVEGIVKNHSLPLLASATTAATGVLPSSLHRLPSQISVASSLSDREDSRLGGSGVKAGTLLTPITDACLGELVPFTLGDDVPSSEDSISIPSFGEETENAAAALAIAQRLATWGQHNSSSPAPSAHSCPPPAIHGSGEHRRACWEARTRSETLTMTNDELRDALLAVLQRKEEIEEKNISLRSLLDHEMEMCAGLRAEIEDIRRYQEDRNEKAESKVQALSRENELLKHQLKKYIGAVQMLKKDGYKAHETLTSMVGDVQPAMPEPKNFIDHHFESTEYERKLVQVAEMHGELMEFNERLHRLLLYRETTIRRLREELVELRGPLPDDNQTSDDELSITSDYDASSQTAISRTLINIWIPSAFLSGRAADVHHVYQVYIRIRDDEWNVYRRYSQFYSLHKSLKKKLPLVHTFDFPPKKTLGKKGSKVVEERRKRLQHYLRCIVNLLMQTSTELTSSPDRETFMTLLPFFREQSPPVAVPGAPPQAQQPQRRRFPVMGSSPPQSQQPPQLYTGL